MAEEIKSYDQMGPITYPFVVTETWQCNICKKKFIAEIEYISPDRIRVLSPSAFLESLIKHRDEHVKAGKTWKAWNLTWGKK